MLKIYTSFNTNRIISISRDNASNNNSFINLYKKNVNATVNDVRCAALILNLVVQDILRGYILDVYNENDIVEYTDAINTDASISNNTSTCNEMITTKVRKMATLIKYTQENRKLLLEGIEKY